MADIGDFLKDSELEFRRRYKKQFGVDPPLDVGVNDLDRAMRFGQPIPDSPEETLAKESTGLIQQTAPLRNRLIGRSERFLRGGDVTSSPQYDVVRQLADEQAKTAKDSILSTLPSGGVLLDKLADVDIGTARTLSLAGSDIYSRELDRAISLATGTPLAAGLGGLGAIAQLEAARNQAAAGREAAQKQAMGTGLGMFLGGVF